MVARKTRWAFAAVWALSSVSLAAAADSVDDVIKKIVEKAGAVTSLQMKMTSEFHNEAGDSKTDSKIASTMIWAKKGGKTCYRMENDNKTVSTMNGQETKMDGKNLVVCDGEFQYTLSEMGEHRMAMKSRAPETAPGVTTMESFDTLRKDYDLKLLPDATVDGHACWVIEATAKKPTEGGMHTMTMYFCQQTGCALKTEMKGPDGKVMGSTTVTDLKTGIDVPADTFKFKAPEGVEVMDMTKPQPGETPPPAETPKTDDKPATPPASDKPATPPASDKPAPTPAPTTPSVPKLPGVH